MKIKMNVKNVSCDFLFIAVGYICLNFYGKYTHCHFNPLPIPMGIVAAIILVYVFPTKNKKDECIYKNKKALYPFCILYSMLISVTFIFNKLLDLNNSTVSNFNLIYIILAQLGITGTIFICYFFKIRLKDFNWKISMNYFALVIAVFIVYELLLSFDVIHQGSFSIRKLVHFQFIIGFVLNVIVHAVIPGLFEEVLYRGFLISGLKGFELSDNLCNSVQAVLFGLSHIMAFGMPSSWIELLKLAIQAMVGYLFGKIYFKTKSLLPCILLHGLLDAAATIM